MKAKNKFQKYKYYLTKRKDVFFHGLQQSQLKGRKIGPKVVLNSLPKSGTHLLETLFLNMPLMRHNGKKTLRIQLQDPFESKLKTIESLKSGQFLLSHMQYHEAIIETISNINAKAINLTRDPRDVLLSHLTYIEKMDTTQKSHNFITQYNTRADKIKAMFEGKKDVLEPFQEVLKKFEPWINHKNVLSLKFEDLIGEKGGGNNQNQRRAVEEIFEYLSIDIKQNQLSKICETIYSPKSSTFNKGKLGNWKYTLTKEEQEWIHQRIETQIEAYGYGI